MHSAFFQLGRLHIPVFGVAAAVGLLAALALSQRTARVARLDPSAVWDAGLMTVIAAFVLSRALLVVFNFQSFLLYPVLLLAVPSLTSLGVLLTAALMFLYLRWKRLPVRAVLDAAAPCGALLWLFLSLGRLLDGTREGMPSALPWAMPVAGSANYRVQPVEAYTLAAAFVICLALLVLQPRLPRAGETAAVALLAGGAAGFFLDFVRVPTELFAGVWFEPAQLRALALVVAGGIVLWAVESKNEDPIGVENAV